MSSWRWSKSRRITSTESGITQSHQGLHNCAQLIFAQLLMLTLVIALLAMTVGGASATVALSAWGNGLWVLLTLAMQFTLMMVVAYACAVSPPIERLFVWLASRPDHSRPRQALVLMALFSTLTAWLNWAFSLVVAAAFLPFVVRANPRADFRLLVACAYLGVGTVFHTGLSGSAPLIIAT